MKKTISQKVLEKINQKKLSVKPGCFFTLQSIFWLFFSGLFFLATILLGSLLFQYLFQMKFFSMIFLKPLLTIIAFPFVPFFIFLLLIFLVARCYRQSQCLCRHEEWLLLGTILLGALTIGIALGQSNAHRPFWEVCEKNPWFQKIIVTPKEYWSQPNKGALSGKIIHLKDGQTFLLESCQKKQWLVEYQPEKIKPQQRSLKKNQPVRLVGEMKDQQSFKTWAIWEW